jgi:MFS family permease
VSSQITSGMSGETQTPYALLDEEKLGPSVTPIEFPEGRRRGSTLLSPGRRRVLFLSVMAIMLLQYLFGTLYSSFFPKSPQGQDIAETTQGVIFASYGLGVALFAPVIGTIIKRVGNRAVICAGMFLMGCFAILFGLTPIMVATPPIRCGLLIAFNFLGGAMSSFAEVAGFALVTKLFPENTGMVTAVGEVMTGLGSTLGPFIGGLLYEAFAPLGTDLQFFMPFLACGTLVMLLDAALLVVLRRAPHSYSESDTATGSVWNVGIMLVLAANFLASTAWMALDPTLEVKMTSAPFHLTPPQVGLMFLAEGLVYTALALPMGWMVDKRPRAANVMMFLGLCCFAVGLGLLGPLKLGPFSTHLAFDNSYAAVGGLVAIALGNSLIIVATRPAMTQALGGGQTDEQAAILTGLWISVYAVGGIVGAVAGPALLTLRTPTFCQDEGRTPCFDGMGSVFSLTFSLFAVCFVALTGCCRLRRARTSVSSSKPSGPESISAPLLD